jgi:hypothetical protein
VSVFHKQARTQQTLRDAWFTVGLADAATFLTVLANSALNMNSLHNGGDLKETPVSMKYQTLAIKYTNSQLANTGAIPTDQTIGTVTGLMCYNVNQQIRSTWTVFVNAW